MTTYKWISVHERLPTEGVKVLAFYRDYLFDGELIDQGILELAVQGGEWYIPYLNDDPIPQVGFEITHWIPTLSYPH